LNEPNRTSILVVAPDAEDQFLSSLIATAEVNQTPLGPSEITWAHSFEEGIERLSNRPFEACLVDSGLGAGSIRFLHEARARGWRRPLILCTRVGESDLQLAAQAAGASDVITKSAVSLNSLGRTVQAAIQRSRLDETLRFGQEMVSLLVEGTRDYTICMLDREGRILTWNQGGERMTGYSSLDAIGRHAGLLFLEEERQALKPADLLRDAVLHGRAETEGKRLRKDGSTYWAHDVITPLYGPDGALRGFSLVSRDVTARKQAEQAKQQSGEQSLASFRAAPVPSIILRSGDESILDANEAFATLVGWSRSEILGRTPAQVGFLEAKARETLRSLMAAGRGVRDVEMQVHRKDGSPRTVVVGVAQLNLTGEACFTCSFQDITARRKAESIMEEAERIVGMASWEWDIPGRKVWWSPNFASLLGLGDGSMRVRTYLEHVHEEDRADVEATMRSLREYPAPFLHEHRVVRDDGVVLWIRARGTVAMDADGRVVRLVGTVQDISDDRIPASTLERGRQPTSELETGFGSVGEDPPSPQAGAWTGTPKLIVARGAHEGLIYALDREDRSSWVIGRAQDSDVRLAQDLFASRRHAEIRFEGGAYKVRGSAGGRNGVYINGRRLAQDEDVALRDGDILSIGRSLLVFRES
jgi:PAS domain S-box-containing protein